MDSLKKLVKKNHSNYCKFPGCSEKGEKGFFKFPNDEPRQSQWLQVCGMSRNDITDKTKICQKHFKVDDIRHFEKMMKLKPTAIPVNTSRQGRASPIRYHMYAQKYMF